MKGKVTSSKFPKGLYFCGIKDVKEGLNTSTAAKFLSVEYEILEGPREGQTFKERVKPSSEFLKALEEPYEVGCEYDTNHWLKKELYVKVDYSADSSEWPRYKHFKDDPEGPKVEEGKDEEIPF